MRVIVAAICLILTCNCLVAHPRGGGGSPPAATEISDSLFERAIACIKRFEGWHGNHLPYVGWGHKLLPGETFRTGYEQGTGGFIAQSGFEETVQDVQPFWKGRPFSRHLVL